MTESEKEPPFVLAQWLDYQQRVHDKPIDMGLQRIQLVATRLALRFPRLLRPAPLCITVAGTNGKGSTVALLQALLQARGLRVACYTSPHILLYNERIVVAGTPVSDAVLCDAFVEIERARADTPLTFFEFATLAALLIFSSTELDAAIFEVGLGGRLDAVNILDADAAIITTIDLDHQEYLGPDRESIGFEKAGVLRRNQLAVYADLAPVRSVLEHAKAIGTRLLRPRFDYHVSRDGADIRFQYGELAAALYPWPPALRAAAQLHNVGAALAITHALIADGRLHSPTHESNYALDCIGLQHVAISGRLQLVHAQPPIYLDVAHNPQAAASIAQWLHANPIRGKTIAIFGGLHDKALDLVVKEVAPYVQQWLLAGLAQESVRGTSALQLGHRVRGATRGDFQSFDTPVDALEAAIAMASRSPDSRIIGFGSFYLVAALFRATSSQLSDV